MELAGCWRSIEARSAVTHSDRRSSVETFFKSGIVRDVGAQRSGRVMRRRRSDRSCRIFGVNGNLAKKTHIHTHKHTEHRKMGEQTLFLHFLFSLYDEGCEQLRLLVARSALAFC